MRRLSRKHLGTLLVVLTLVLAGCSGGGGTATADGDDGGNSVNAGEWSAEQHNKAIENAGSYTIVIEGDSVTARGNDITQTSNFNFTVKHDLETSEYLFTFGSDTGNYRPPNSDTIYTKFGERVQEQSASESNAFDYTNLTNEDATSNVTAALNKLEVKSGSTDLGPAYKYVVTEETDADLPNNVSSEYGEVKSYTQTVWIDKDTGVLAKLTSKKTVVDGAGDEHTIEQSFEVKNLGSTEIERPDWVPEN